MEEKQATADSRGLWRFIEGKVLHCFDDRRKEIGKHPLLRG
jgi:hypothetical protein